MLWKIVFTNGVFPEFNELKGFEERLRSLEEIIDQIRDRGVPLEKAMQLFDNGVEISRQLEKELEGFERKVQILTNQPPADGSGSAQTDDFKPETESGSDA